MWKDSHFELAVLQLLKKRPVMDIKCVLIAPNKALCQQKYNEWKSMFFCLKLSLIELTGNVVAVSLHFIKILHFR